jgi:hypothetical protein
MFERIKVAVTRLAHSRNCVKQIIEKPIEARKNYAPWNKINFIPAAMLAPPSSGYTVQILESSQQEIPFSEVPLF